MRYMKCSSRATFRFLDKRNCWNVDRGVGRGHWAMLPLGAEGALCDCSVPSNRKRVYRESVVGWPTKVPPNSRSMCLQGKLSWRAPSGALRRPSTTKCFSEKSLQWRPYGALLGWSGALLTLAPSWFSKYASECRLHFLGFAFPSVCYQRIAATYLENREGRGQGLGEPSLEGLLGVTFRRWRAPEGTSS